jgi:hypothetical protein
MGNRLGHPIVNPTAPHLRQMKSLPQFIRQQFIKISPNLDRIEIGADFVV